MACSCQYGSFYKWGPASGSLHEGCDHFGSILGAPDSWKLHVSSAKDFCSAPGTWILYNIRTLVTRIIESLCRILSNLNLAPLSIELTVAHMSRVRLEVSEKWETHLYSTTVRRQQFPVHSSGFRRLVFRLEPCPCSLQET